MDALDVFNQDAFGLVSLTEVVNDITPQYGELGKMGLFTDEGVSNRTVGIDFDPITNSLVPSSRWGAPGAANKSGVAKTVPVAIPHLLLSDNIEAADLQSRRRPGSDQVQDAQYVTGKKLLEMRTKLDQTLEYMRLGVLRGGLVKDGAGTTVLDMYSTFGLTQDSTAFVLATTTTDVKAKIAIVKRNIKKNLRGEILNGFVALCSDGFWDSFISHPVVEKPYLYFLNNGQNLGSDYTDGFMYMGIVWMNYSGAVTDAAGNSQDLIDADSAYMVPRGTKVFKTFYAPADYMETVNTMGQAFYAKQERLKFDKGIELECQSNPIPLCTKPMVIQKLTKA